MRLSSRILASLLLASSLTFATTATTLAEPGYHGGNERSQHGKMADGMGGKPRHHDGMASFDHIPRFLRGITLSEEQRDKIFEITYAQIPAHRTFHKEMRKLKQQMHGLPLSADYDAGKMKKLVDTQTKLKGEHMLKMAETHNRIYKLLTDEQRKQLAERKAKRAQKAI